MSDLDEAVERLRLLLAESPSQDPSWGRGQGNNPDWPERESEVTEVENAVRTVLTALDERTEALRQIRSWIPNQPAKKETLADNLLSRILFRTRAAIDSDPA